MNFLQRTFYIMLYIIIMYYESIENIYFPHKKLFYEIPFINLKKKHFQCSLKMQYLRILQSQYTIISNLYSFTFLLFIFKSLSQYQSIRMFHKLIVCILKKNIVLHKCDSLPNFCLKKYLLRTLKFMSSMIEEKYFIRILHNFCIIHKR